jgi:NTP pyrophosphatase (non-canonical NTP hydrolase)
MMQDFDRYQELAMRTNGTTHQRDCLNNAALGMTGEAGEFADQIKKWLYHKHPLDRAKLKKEIGDVLWYCAQAAHGLGVSLGAIAEENIIKLQERYPEGFSHERSINRSDGT